MEKLLSIVALCAVSATLPVATFSAHGAESHECVSGVYPHLAMFNDEGECGTGAVVPWAGDLWVITYGPHLPVGSSDKLYRIKPDLTREVFPGSVGGTPANRLVHRETNQLLIGPYVIDAKGNVRVVPPAKMPGRLTGAARHVGDPANKVYVATMETGLYELDMRTLAVNTLVRENGMNDKTIGAYLKRLGLPWPDGWDSAPRTRVPGYHSKGLASGFGRVFISNNGENSKEARSNPFVPSGVLAWWNEPGKDWTTIRRCQFTEVTTPDGIYGNEHPDANPVWAMGWDAKSVILGVTTNGAEWTYYRLPKASHCYDGAHGWNTEWPRIRDVGFGDGTLLATMHGTFWRFPKGFSPANPNGIRPISTYLKVIGDFCRWGDRIVFGCDDQAKNEFLGKRKLKKGAPRCERSQSNLWFVKPEELKSFGPPSGEGYVWLREDVKAGDVSDPYLHAGYETMLFSFTRADGSPVSHELVQEGDWVRVKCLEDAKGATARFCYGPARCATPALDAKSPFVMVKDDKGTEWKFPNVNGDTNVVCREISTERDLLYVGGVWYELPAENAGGFAALRPIALADEPVRTLEAKRGMMFLNGKAMVIDDLWKNGTAPAAYWLFADVSQAGYEKRVALKGWFLDNVYGRAPIGRPGDMSFEGNSILFGGGRMKVNLTVAMPKGASAEKPCPVLLMGDFRTWNNGVHDNDYTRKEQAKQDAIDAYATSRGYAVVHYNLNEAAPDQPRRKMFDEMRKAGKPLPACPYGLFDVYGGESDRTDWSWGTIRAWAWCHSRVLDWIETQPALDARRVAVLGHSRLGKTALCAGVTDPRFKVVYSNASGCGGAKLNRKDLPRSEHISQITRGFPYWFCRNFLRWRGRDMEIEHDQDEWMGLIAAPGRYLYVASGSADNWAGPAGEKAAAESAAKAWEALGLKGMGGHVGYHCHNGSHDLGVGDIKLFLDFCDTRL